MLADFHSHTTLSDGALSFDQLVGAAERYGYDVLAITDHVSPDVDHRDIARTVRREVDRLAGETSVQLVAGVEITDYAPWTMDAIALQVREAGAQIVVAHGECLMLDVIPGTNAAAVRSRNIDILAHPGLLKVEDAIVAGRNGVLIELSALVHAAYANGSIFRVTHNSGSAFIVNSNAHEEDHLLSARKIGAVVIGAGGSPIDIDRVMQDTPAVLLRRVMKALAAAS